MSSDTRRSSCTPQIPRPSAFSWRRGPTQPCATSKVGQSSTQPATSAAVPHVRSNALPLSGLAVSIPPPSLKPLLVLESSWSRLWVCERGALSRVPSSHTWRAANPQLLDLLTTCAQRYPDECCIWSWYLKPPHILHTHADEAIESNRFVHQREQEELQAETEHISEQGAFVRMNVNLTSSLRPADASI